MRDAIEGGRVDALEAEQLVGFLTLGESPGWSESTRRRRRARLRALGIPERSPEELQAWELQQRVARGEMGPREAEIRMGRFALAEVDVRQRRARPLGGGALAAPLAG